MLKHKANSIDGVQSRKSRIVVVIASINMLLAVVAFIKDAAFAFYFGTSSAADAFNFAFFIPDTLGNNILATSLGISSIPLFSRLLVANDKRSLKLAFHKLENCTFIAACLLGLLVFSGSSFLVRLAGVELSGGMGILSSQALKIMAFTIPIYPAAAIGISMLQAKGRFIAASAAPVVFNLVFLGGILSAICSDTPAGTGIKLIAVFVLLSAVGMLGLVCAALITDKKLFEAEHSLPEKAVPGYENVKLDGFIRTSVYYCGILLLTQTTLFIERLLALGYSRGGISGLNYAYRLAQLPIWVIIAAIGTVILPMMSKSWVENKSAEQILIESIKIMFITTAPIVVILFILRVPIVSMLFMRGAFDNDSVLTTASILEGYSLAILGQGVSALCLRYFISAGEVHKPFAIFFVSTVSNIVLDLYLVKRIGLAGLGYGAFAGGIISALLFLYTIGLEKAFFTGATAKTLSRVVLANLSIGLLALLFLYIWDIYARNSGASGSLLYTLLLAAVGLPVFYRYLKYFELV